LVAEARRVERELAAEVELRIGGRAEWRGRPEPDG
jgi:hypothetical protein